MHNMLTATLFVAMIVAPLFLSVKVSGDQKNS
jgi:hypothetical protein